MLHPVTAETQASAMEALADVAIHLDGARLISPDEHGILEECLGVSGAELSPRSARALIEGFERGDAFARLHESFPGHAFASVRNGVETATVDALCRMYQIPLVELFRCYRGTIGEAGGGESVSDRRGSNASTSVRTDITIPICPADEARLLASEYQRRGFDTIKVKVGGDAASVERDDMERLNAIREGFPTCKFVIDCNEGYDADGVLRLIDAMDAAGIAADIKGDIVLEQPVPREDFDGLRAVTAVANARGIAVAADESCRSVKDALVLTGLDGGAGGPCCDIVNIKLAKVGVIGALKIVDLCLRADVDLMIGGMVETRLGMAFAASLVAGLTPAFRYVDLDTPLLLAGDPVNGDRVSLRDSVWTINRASSSSLPSSSAAAAKAAGYGLGLCLHESHESWS